jgi:hypothetical protein
MKILKIIIKIIIIINNLMAKKFFWLQKNQFLINNNDDVIMDLIDQFDGVNTIILHFKNIEICYENMFKICFDEDLKK